MHRNNIDIDLRMDTAEDVKRAKQFCIPIDGLLFHPWRGHKYEEGFNGTKILVLGESAFLPHGSQEKFDAEYREWQQTWFCGSILEYYEGGKGRYNYWTKWIGAFLGRRDIALEDKQFVLDRVSFWNFGDIMLPAPRMPIPKGHLPTARERYEKVIAELKPQLVIALCYRLWDVLPMAGHEADPVLHFETWRYDDKQTEYSLLCLPHPSSPAWQFEKTSAAIKTAFEQTAIHA